MKDYQLHFLFFGVEFISVACYENIELTTSVSIFDLYLPILFHFISDCQLVLLKYVLFIFFSSIQMEMSCVLTWHKKS